MLTYIDENNNFQAFLVWIQWRNNIRLAIKINYFAFHRCSRRCTETKRLDFRKWECAFLACSSFLVKKLHCYKSPLQHVNFLEKDGLAIWQCDVYIFLSFCCRSSSQMMERGAVGSSGFPHRSDRKQFVFFKSIQ